MLIETTKDIHEEEEEGEGEKREARELQITKRAEAKVNSASSCVANVERSTSILRLVAFRVRKIELNSRRNERWKSSGR